MGDSHECPGRAGDVCASFRALDGSRRPQGLPGFVGVSGRQPDTLKAYGPALRPNAAGSQHNPLRICAFAPGRSPSSQTTPARRTHATASLRYVTSLCAHNTASRAPGSPARSSLRCGLGKRDAAQTLLRDRSVRRLNAGLYSILPRTYTQRPAGTALG